MSLVEGLRKDQHFSRNSSLNNSNRISRQSLYSMQREIDRIFLKKRYEHYVTKKRLSVT